MSIGMYYKQLKWSATPKRMPQTTTELDSYEGNNSASLDITPSTIAVHLLEILICPEWV